MAKVGVLSSGPWLPMHAHGAAAPRLVLPEGFSKQGLLPPRRSDGPRSLAFANRGTLSAEGSGGQVFSRGLGKLSPAPFLWNVITVAKHIALSGVAEMTGRSLIFAFLSRIWFNVKVFKMWSRQRNGIVGANLNLPEQAWKVTYGHLGRRTNLIALFFRKRPANNNVTFDSSLWCVTT